MSSIPPRSRILALALAGALVVATPFALSGCGLIEGVVENQTGSDIDLGGTDLPADFPDGVPLVDGDVVFGASIGGDSQKIWNVTLTAEGANVLDEIIGQFEDAGFSATPVSETAQGSVITFTKDPFGVLVVVGSGAGGDQVAIYTVTRSSNG